MSRSKTSFLVDVNVWLAIAYDRHLHHEAASDWFQDLGRNSAYLCRITQLGLLRLLTNGKLMGTDVRSQAKAWNILDTLLEDERVAFATEPSGLDDAFRSLTKAGPPSVNLWTDAYLAAFSQSAGLQLATFDKALSRMCGASGRLL